MAMRKMRKGKSATKKLAAPGAKSTYARGPKRPTQEDIPGHMRGGKSPVGAPRGMGMGKSGMSSRAKKLRGLMI